MDVNPALTMRYGTVDTAYAARMAATPPEDDGPIWMVNLMHYRERADYADGRESTISGMEADDLYAPYAALDGVGAEIVFVGTVDTQFLNDDPKWDRVAVVKYPSRRAFLEMQDFLRDKGIRVQAIPEQLEHIESLPRNASGKIVKNDLRDRYRDLPFNRS